MTKLGEQIINKIKSGKGINPSNKGKASSETVGDYSNLNILKKNKKNIEDDIKTETVGWKIRNLQKDLEEVNNLIQQIKSKGNVKKGDGVHRKPLSDDPRVNERRAKARKRYRQRKADIAVLVDAVEKRTPKSTSKGMTKKELIARVEKLEKELYELQQKYIKDVGDANKQIINVIDDVKNANIKKGGNIETTEEEVLPEDGIQISEKIQNKLEQKVVSFLKTNKTTTKAKSKIDKITTPAIRKMFGSFIKSTYNAKKKELSEEGFKIFDRQMKKLLVEVVKKNMNFSDAVSNDGVEMFLDGIYAIINKNMN